MRSVGPGPNPSTAAPAGLAIGRRPVWPLRGPAGAPEALVLVGHGSDCLVSEREMQHLGDLVAAALPDVAVGVGFLEMTDPPAGRVIDAVVAGGARRVVVLPLVLLAAGHAKNDVPAVVVEARHRHPGVDVRFGAPLGVARALIGVLGDAVVAAGAGRLPLLVVARGTSDPDANGDAVKVGRLVGEWTAAPFTHTGFTGVTGPSVTEAATVFARLGHRRVAVAWWFLGHGKLIERGRRQLAAVAADTGVDWVDVGHLGPDPRVVPLVVARYVEARDGAVAFSCDTCAYRAPWPGLAERVGQQVGVGHSHLAEAHRHG